MINCGKPGCGRRLVGGYHCLVHGDQIDFGPQPAVEEVFDRPASGAMCMDCGNAPAIKRSSRCQPCRVEYARKRLEAVQEIVHGTERAYRKGCHCEPCLEIHRQNWHKYNKRRMESRQEERELDAAVR